MSVSFDNPLSRSSLSPLLSMAAADPDVNPSELFATLALLNELHESADLQRAAILLALPAEKRPSADPWVEAWAAGAERLLKAPLADIPQALKGQTRESRRLEAAIRLAALQRPIFGLSDPSAFAIPAKHDPDAALSASPEPEAAQQLGIWLRPIFINPKMLHAESERALARALLRAQALCASGEPLARTIFLRLLELAKRHPCRQDLLPQRRRTMRFVWRADSAAPEEIKTEMRKAGRLLRAVGTIVFEDFDARTLWTQEWLIKGDAFGRAAASLAARLAPRVRARQTEDEPPAACTNMLGSFGRALLIHGQASAASSPELVDPFEPFLKPGSGISFLRNED